MAQTTNMPPSYQQKPLTELRRYPERGSYEREMIHSILDEGLVCHVGFITPHPEDPSAPQPFVIPTVYARLGEIIYIHGSPASRMFRNLKKGVDICLTVTLVDGIVLARSAYNSSLNYRSVVVFGKAEVVEGEEKLRALDAITEHIAPGRSNEARPMSAIEVRATLVIKVDLHDVSAKFRFGPPEDEEEDLSYPVWAGVIPLRSEPGTPIADPHLGNITATDVVTKWRKPGPVIVEE
jgi:hypothetical protein